MLPITGYAEQWSVPQGGRIRFMVSVQGAAPFRARIAHVLCADPNPAGPGYREVPMPSALDGEHPGTDQPMRLGSWAEVPALLLPDAPLTLAATIWPTRPGPEQVVLAVAGGATLTLGIGAHGAFARRGEVTVPAGPPRTARAWHDISCTVGDGTLGITQAPHRPRLDIAEGATATAPATAAPQGMGRAAIAASPGGGRHFDGKIARPRVLRGETTVAAWDFARGIPTDHIADAGPGGWHGRLHNLPTRAMTGPGWDGRVHRWTEAPGQYDAIHFHADDIGDAGWAPSLALDVPGDWPSGVYALHLETAAGRDNIVFYVRAREPGRVAPVAFLAPTFTYQVYGNFHRPGRQAENAARAAAWGALPHAPDGHPEYGLSTYNHHGDGSGVALASMRRPMIDKRVNHFQMMDPDPTGSGTYWISADSTITDLLDRRGIPFEVITDHDVHEQGAALLSKYRAVLTGQHPEYHTHETLDAIAGFLGAGGRFMYLGGNGFYWRVAPHPDGPWALEVRRAEGGIRLWAAEPGEGYHAFDGGYGGLWRRLGRPPQALVGVGFATQGRYVGMPYTFADGILDPRVAFLREGLPEATPGTVFGERGFMGGGAAGHELDRVDARLGTPHHALVVASAIATEETYQPVNEERFDHVWPGPREDFMRADICFFETPGGGAVFSVGSMNFIGALPVDGYRGVCARLVENAVRRFMDPAPLTL